MGTFPPHVGLIELWSILAINMGLTAWDERTCLSSLGVDFEKDLKQARLWDNPEYHTPTRAQGRAQALARLVGHANRPVEVCASNKRYAPVLRSTLSTDVYMRLS